MKDALELEREDERLKALHASVSASVEKHKELEAWCTLKFSQNAWLYFWTMLWKLYCCSSMRLKALQASVTASVEKQKELEAWCTLKFSWKLYCCSSMRLKALHASVTASVEKQKELQAWFTFKFSWILVWKCNSGSYALVSLRVPYETAGADNTFALHFPLSAGAQRDLKKHHNNHLRVQKDGFCEGMFTNWLDNSNEVMNHEMTWKNSSIYAQMIHLWKPETYNLGCPFKEET